MSMSSIPHGSIEQDVVLAPHTTIKLGGKAKYFCRCTDLAQIYSALRFVGERDLRVHILGGGSNVIFADEGFNGLVVQIALTGVSFADQGDTVLVAARAGEEWDTIVERCVVKGLGGIECLSGIPGKVGATPIQNVGAYG